MRKAGCLVREAKVMGPRVVPRHSDFKNLHCQRALSGSRALKAFCRAVKPGRQDPADHIRDGGTRQVATPAEAIGSSGAAVVYLGTRFGAARRSWRHGSVGAILAVTQATTVGAAAAMRP